MRIARTLPPVGYRLPVSDLLEAARQAMFVRGSHRSALEREFAEYFNVRRAVAVSSGKAGLTLILLALKALSRRRKVILPAYACYSIPSSILKAGLDVVPCDIASGSFDYDYDQLAGMLDDDVLCVLSVHLFGIPSDTARVNALCRPRGIFVVEDAAQALRDVSDGALLGTTGDVGFFSFGRGKNISCGSGGVVVTNSQQIADELSALDAHLGRSSTGDQVRTLLTMACTSVFMSPNLYWLPAGLPFLRLGETIFYDDFPRRRLSGLQAVLLRNWSIELAALNRARRANAEFYLHNIRGTREYGDRVPYLRFPILVRNRESKDRLVHEQNGSRLGLSGFYPRCISGIPQLEGRLPSVHFPQAEHVAASLVTLPTHPLMSDRDRARICGLVNSVLECP